MKVKYFSIKFNIEKYLDRISPLKIKADHAKFRKIKKSINH
jgi:hypothetical protein